MKLEINIDESFLTSNLNIRDSSFTKNMQLLLSTGNKIRKENPVRFPTFVLDNKLLGYSFAQKCGFNVPKITQLKQSIEKIDFRKNTVIKPMNENASRGVFVAYSNENIIYLNKQLMFSTTEMAREHAKKLLTDKIVKKDEWMVEELLMFGDNLARDIKFYCFYGQVGLILETEREGRRKRCWYDVNLNYVNTGKYLNNSFLGKRQDLEELKLMAEKLSLEIPSPFVRIDFLVSDTGYYVGEFTPVPGSYETFNLDWDKKLGNLFITAAINMAYDVSRGKVFDNYLKTEKLEKLEKDYIKNSNNI